MQEQDKPDRLTREQLVERLAAVSHRTYMRQAERDKGAKDLDPQVTDHDRERAEDTVRELERLGVFGQETKRESDEPREPISFTVIETGDGEQGEEER
jgi:hypothetical protein